jgi:hypothetical protein
VRHIALQRIQDGPLQRGRAVALEQPQQRRRDRAQVVPARTGALEQGGAGRRGLRQAVAAAVGAGRTLLFDQPLHVRCDLDLLATVPAACMAGQFGGAVEDAHPLLVGQHGQGAPHMGMRHGVVVEVEAHVRCLAHRHGHALTERELVLRQRQQLASFGIVGLAHAQGAVLDPTPIGGLGPAPLRGLRVEIVQIGEGAPGEEAVADVADGALHAALLVTARHRHWARLEAVVAGQCQQAWVEADRVALALEHRALEVVVQDHTAAAVERGEGQGVTTQEAVHPGVEEEAQEDHARVAEHHHEGHQRAAGTADGQMAEVTPVDLRLLARQSAQAQVGLGSRAWAHAGDEQAGSARARPRSRARPPWRAAAPQ